MWGCIGESVGSDSTYFGSGFAGLIGWLLTLGMTGLLLCVCLIAYRRLCLETNPRIKPQAVSENLRQISDKPDP